MTNIFWHFILIFKVCSILLWVQEEAHDIMLMSFGMVYFTITFTNQNILFYIFLTLDIELTHAVTENSLK